MSKSLLPLLSAPLVATILSAATFSAGADPFPPVWGTGVASPAGPVHFAPVAWPTEPANIGDCGVSCGQWLPYSRFQAGITDPRTQDPSNGGTAPQNYVNIASSCTDKSKPSVYYNLYKHPTDATLDVLMFRWRVEQVANNYATGPSAGSYSSSDPWSSALWTVLFDLDGDGFRDVAVHLNGSSGSPSTPVDMLASVWGKIPTQSIDYLTDPNIKLIAHNPTAFVTGNTILNFQNSLTPVTTWPAGSNAPGTTYDYGTTRSRVVSSSPCNEYFVDYQIPIKMLDASATGPNPALNGPKMTRSTPLSMLFCTANSLNNPFQKDCAVNRSFVADESKAGPYGDYISFDQTSVYAQPIISSVSASPPAICPAPYKLETKVQDTLYLDSSGVVKSSVKQVQFFYWLDQDGDGTAAGDTGSAWTLAATATLKPGTLNTWIADWDATGLPKGKYLIGVQAVDDKTLHDDGVPNAPVDNRTFSYMVGSVDTLTQGQIYTNPWTFDGTTKTWVSGGAGGWITGQQALFQSHTSAMVPGTNENWFGNPAVTGVQTALIGLAVNACGVAPTLSKVASPTSVAAGQAVTFTVTLNNTTGGTIKLTRIDDPLPSGFTYAGTTSVNNGVAAVTPSTTPAPGDAGTVSWTFGGTGIDVANNTSVVLVFTSTASATVGTFNNTASASTSMGSITSGVATVGVDAARVSLSKTPSTYLVNPGGTLSYTLAYANDSSVAVTGATLTDTLPANVTCNTYAVNGGATQACSGSNLSVSLGTLAGGATGSVVVNVTVGAGYASSSLLNTATLDVIAPDGSTHVSKTATSTIAVAVPAPAFSLSKTASAAKVDPGSNVTWTIAYQNYGTGPASSVVLTDPLPLGFTYQSSTPTATSAPAVNNNGTVSWNLGTVAAGASGSVQVVAKASNPYTGTANPATNTASLNWTGGSAVTASSQVGVTQTGQTCQRYYPGITTTTVGTLTGNKEGTATPLSGSQYVVLTTVPSGATATVSTAGTDVATEVARFYQDPVSSQLVTFDGASTLTGQLFYTKGNSFGLTLTAKVYDYNPATGTETLIGSASYADQGNSTPPISLASVVPTGALSKGHRLLIVVLAQWAANKTGTTNLFVNDARSYIEVCAPAPANLVLQKSVNTSSIAATGTGRQLTYTLNYSNTSSATAATTAVLTDTLPAGTTFVSQSATPAATSLTTPAVGANGVVTWNFASIAAGVSGSASVTVAVPDDLTGTTVINNQASLSSTQTAAINASASTAVIGGGATGTPALVLAKSANKTLLVAGESVTYTLTVVNTGSGNASTVVVTDDFPDQPWFTYGSCTASAGTCSQSPAGTLSWNLGGLAAGASASLSFTMNVAATGLPAGVTTLNNTATVADSAYCTGGAPPASCTSNTVAVTVSGNPNLNITKTSLPATVHPGDVVTYTMVVTNTGSGAATGVVVSDPVPSYTVFKAITNAGPGTASFDSVGNRVVYNVGTLAAGASATVAFSANVTALAPGNTTITNTAQVLASNSTVRSASASSNGNAAPVMTLQKTGAASVPFPATTLSAAANASTSLFVTSSALLATGDWIQVMNGTSNPMVRITAVAGNVLTVSAAVTANSGSTVRRGVSWYMTYQNTGNADASGVTVTDPLPANWVYVSATPAASTSPAVGANGSVVWNLGTVTPGTSGTLEVVAMPQASGSVTNVATLRATALADVSSSVVTVAGGVTITKRTTTPTVSAGGVANYVIDVTNTLNAPVGGVTVSDSLSSGFTYKANSATLTYVGGGTNGALEPTLSGNDAAQPVWSGLTIGANGSVTITFQANVSAGTGPATYQNFVALTGVPGNVGITPFDPLTTTAEDVTVLGANTGTVSGYVYQDLNNNGVFDPAIDVPLAGVTVTLTDANNTIYTVATDASGFYSRVVAAGNVSVDVLDGSLPGGLTLAAGNTDPATVVVPDGGNGTKNTGYISAANAADMGVSVAGLPTTGSLNVAYTGSFSCTNTSNLNAAVSATCTVAGLPAGLSVGACVLNPGNTAWTSPANVPASATVTCAVSGTPTATGVFNVTGSTGAFNDPNTANNAAFTTITIAQTPALAITKTHAANFAAGSTGSYAVSVSNAGGSASTGTVTVTDTPPAGMTITAMSGTGWNCTPPSCTRSDALAPAGTYPTITVTVQIANAATTPLVNSVTVSGGGSASATATDSTVIGYADMRVTLTGFPANTGPGVVVRGTFTCTNQGVAPAVNASCSVTSGATLESCKVGGNVVTLPVANLPVGSSIVCTAVATAPANGSFTVNVATTAANDSGVTGKTAAQTVTVVATAGTGSISGTVWYDLNANNVQDNGEPGRSGWTVQLLTGSTVLTSATTNSSGNYSFGSLQPGIYTVQFINANGATLAGGRFPVNGDLSGNGGQSSLTGLSNINVTPGGAVVNQSMPLDPSGVVYNSVTRQPIVGATVTLLYNGAPINTAWVAGASATQVTGADGRYAFFILPAAQAGTYSLTVSATNYNPTASTLIPPSTAPGGYAGGSVGFVGAPPVGQVTTYYLSFPLPTIDITNNNIPLDPVGTGAGAGVAAVPSLSTWAVLMLVAFMLMTGVASTRRRHR